MGVQRMTKEHLGLAVNLALPSFVVITKIDIAPDHVKQQTLQVITRILKSGAAGRKMPMVVKTEDDVVTAAREVGNKKMVPIFFVSNVTGEGIDMLKQFLNLLPSAPKWEKKLSKPAEFQVDESFHITVCKQRPFSGSSDCFTRDVSPLTLAFSASGHWHCRQWYRHGRAHQRQRRDAVRPGLTRSVPESDFQRHTQQARPGHDRAGGAVVFVCGEKDQAQPSAQGSVADSPFCQAKVVLVRTCPFRQLPWAVPISEMR